MRTTLATLQAEGERWKADHDRHFQFVASRMQHHIHPKIADGSKRRILPSCIRKSRPKECRGGFPLDAELCEDPVLVCEGIACARGLPVSGDRSSLGAMLPARSDPMLNATAPGLATFFGENTDLKFPNRVPLIAITHDPTCDSTSCVSTDVDKLGAQVQVAPIRMQR